MTYLEKSKALTESASTLLEDAEIYLMKARKTEQVNAETAKSVEKEMRELQQRIKQIANTL